MPPTPHFGKELFGFLRELKRKNDREWFAANRERYETAVRDPFLRFIGDFAAPLAALSEHFVADPRPVGGSFFRIHRDTRFSQDKTPYKTHAAAQFRHEAGKDVHAPGFYLHLEPGQVFAGVGLWRPEAEPLRRVRDAIVEQPAAWKRAVQGKAFRARWELGGESLVRPPQGYDREHPLIEDLKRKDFVAMASFTEADACSARFEGELARAYREARALMAFLTAALGLPF
jgi:uncharacterized protein (TIGR02453 family)